MSPSSFFSKFKNNNNKWNSVSILRVYIQWQVSKKQNTAAFSLPLSLRGDWGLGCHEGSLGHGKGGSSVSMPSAHRRTGDCNNLYNDLINFIIWGCLYSTNLLLYLFPVWFYSIPYLSCLNLFLEFLWNRDLLAISMPHKAISPYR